MSESRTSTDIFQLRNLLLQCRLSQLVAACRHFNLKKSGSKPEVLERLLSFLVSASTEERNNLSIALTNTNGSLRNNLVSIPRDSVASQSSSHDYGGVVSDAKALTVQLLQEGNADMDNLLDILKKIDPFHPLAPITYPYLYLAACKSGSTSFSLDLPDLKSLRRQGYSVWLRCANKDAGKHDRHIWPRELHVYVNLSQVFKVEAPKKLKKRRDEPVDLTAYLQSGRNQIQLSVLDSTPGNFTMALTVCGSLGNEAIVSSVPYLSAQDCRERIIKILVQTNSELFVEESQDGFVSFDLRCPISLERIVLPARGVTCEHLRCFDLHAFVSVNRQTSNINLRWMCPICSKIILPEDLVIDTFIKEIVVGTPSSEVQILIHPGTAEWKLIESKVSERNQEDSPDANDSEQPIDAQGDGEVMQEALIELIDDSPRNQFSIPFPKKPRLNTELPSALEVIELD